MIHVAAGCGLTGITVDSRARAVGAPGDHDASVKDDKIVVHEASAATSVFGVMKKWNSGFFLWSSRIILKGLIRCCDAIAVGIT